MKIAAIHGTRPEQIKLAPVIEALRERDVNVVEHLSGQSPDLVEQEAAPRWDSLQQGIGDILNVQLDECYLASFDAILVQGDTATAFAAALAGFLAEVPVAHVEAGLRTYRREPWPEEAFRSMIARMARWHFCPDKMSAAHVWMEHGGKAEIQGEKVHLEVLAGTAEHIDVHVVGNPVIDSLPKEPFRILVTLHRRENWGARIHHALEQLEDFVRDHDDVEACVVEHPNWKSWMEFDPIRMWNGLIFVEPMEREEVMDEILGASVVVTDSGGLQEEAAHFGTPCLVYRTATERTALLDCGAVQLVDPDDPRALLRALEQELRKRRCYGSGDAGERIADILVEEIGDE